uniref:beta-ketoacyl-[acyl-carrier-protein] synthase I n=1 Tax=Glossina palpalis gambiensis TaxID=67801 RepID=A0A1B0BU31_9MUSC
MDANSDDFLGFDNTEKMDQRSLPHLEETIDETIDGMTMKLIAKITDELILEMVWETLMETTGEQTTVGMRSLATLGIVDMASIDYSSYEGEGPSTSAQAAARRLRKRHHEVQLQPADEHVVQEEHVMEMRADDHTHIHNIKLCYLEIGWKAAQSFRDLHELFSKGTIRGRSGRGRPSDFDDQALLATLERDESLATRMLDDVGHSTIVRRVKALKKQMMTTLRKDEDKVYSHATGDAMHFIRNSNADIMLAGSGESCIDPLSIAGFCRIRALSTAFNEIPSQTSRPFDKNRDGFVMGEGAAILLLKELEHALQRKANILGEILGYELVTPIISLKKDGHIAKDDVTYVNAHATSTPAGDRFEAQTIHKVFGDHVNKIRVSSTKGHHGHLLGPSGNLDFNKSSRRSQNTTFVKYRRIRGDANQEITFKEAIECSQGRRNYQQKWILSVKGENERWPSSTYDLHKYSALNLQGIEENEMSPG